MNRGRGSERKKLGGEAAGCKVHKQLKKKRGLRFNQTVAGYHQHMNGTSKVYRHLYRHLDMLVIVIVHRCSMWVGLFDRFPPLAACTVFSGTLEALGADPARIIRVLCPKYVVSSAVVIHP